MPNSIHTEKLPDGFSFEMIHVEGGTFMMGSEEGEKIWGREDPIHEVKLDGFYIGKYPVKACGRL